MPSRLTGRVLTDVPADGALALTDGVGGGFRRSDKEGRSRDAAARRWRSPARSASIQQRGSSAKMLSSRRKSRLPDLLERIREELNARLGELRPLVDEHGRLEAAMHALADVRHAPTSTAPASSPVKPTTARAQKTQPTKRRKRAPRGANRQAVLRAASERPGATRAELACLRRSAEHAERAARAAGQSRRAADACAAHRTHGLRARRRAPSATRRHNISRRRGHRERRHHAAGARNMT